MSNTHLPKRNLQVAQELVEFIEQDALPGLAIDQDAFWDGFDSLVHSVSHKNRALLAKRETLQSQINDWHKEYRGNPHDEVAYKAFLEEIGYLLPEGGPFVIETRNVDSEIATIAGPQLVVPSTNARFVLNAANARWGSLYDGLYGTDAIGTPVPNGPFDTGRGGRVVARTAVFLDEAFPVNDTSHSAAKRYSVSQGKLLVNGSFLKDPSKFIGFTGLPEAPKSVLLCNNNLHVELVFDASHAIGKISQSGLADVLIESAISAIVDCEDSVACVDAEDKVRAYRNWLGLMQGNLSETFEKGGKTITRALNSDRTYSAPDGSDVTLKGRALLLVRNVGHLMTNPAILDSDGNEIFEGLMDAMITTLIAMHDLKKSDGARNSTTGSIYVVKPKMHGPEEVAFADEIFTHVEKALVSDVSTRGTAGRGQGGKTGIGHGTILRR